MQNVYRTSALGLDGIASARKAYYPEVGLIAALLLAFGILLLTATTATAQISDGGIPPSFERSLRSNAQRHIMPPVDDQALLAEDAAEESKA